VSLALHNLVGNGLKYTPEGGRVRVKVEAGPRSLVVDVEDNGIGIKPEEHELIFEKFYRARDARVSRITGTGLGLALAREVARLHGGDVLLRSEVDKGSTFTLTLPLAA
jgi:signal transduction histidine kinase